MPSLKDYPVYSNQQEKERSVSEGKSVSEEQSVSEEDSDGNLTSDSNIFKRNLDASESLPKRIFPVNKPLVSSQRSSRSSSVDNNRGKRSVRKEEITFGSVDFKFLNSLSSTKKKSVNTDCNLKNICKESKSVTSSSSNESPCSEDIPECFRNISCQEEKSSVFEIKNWSPSINNEALKELLQTYGTIESLEIISEAGGGSKAVVRMAKGIEVNWIIECLNDARLSPNDKEPLKVQRIFN